MEGERKGGANLEPTPPPPPLPPFFLEGGGGRSGFETREV